MGAWNGLCRCHTDALRRAQTIKNATKETTNFIWPARVLHVLRYVHQPYKAHTHTLGHQTFLVSDKPSWWCRCVAITIFINSIWFQLNGQHIYDSSFDWPLDRSRSVDAAETINLLKNMWKCKLTSNSRRRIENDWSLRHLHKRTEQTTISRYAISCERTRRAHSHMGNRCLRNKIWKSVIRLTRFLFSEFFRKTSRLKINLNWFIDTFNETFCRVNLLFHCVRPSIRINHENRFRPTSIEKKTKTTKRREKLRNSFRSILFQFKSCTRQRAEAEFMTMSATGDFDYGKCDIIYVFLLKMMIIVQWAA